VGDDVKEYERVFTKNLDEEIKTATILSIAPTPVQEYASLNEDKITSYAEARKLFMDYVEAQRNSGMVPMDVRLLSKRLAALEKGKKGGKSGWKGDGGKGGDKPDGGKPKGGGKPDGGKAKGAGKADGGKTKSGGTTDGGKKGKAGDGGKPARFEGYCGNCGIWSRPKELPKEGHSRINRRRR